MPRLMCESDDDKVPRVMGMGMLSDLHWLVGRGTIAGPIQRLVGSEKPPYVPANTMASLDLRGSHDPSYGLAGFESA